MKTSYTPFKVVLFAVLFGCSAVGCTETSLIGNPCASGFTLNGDRCVSTRDGMVPFDAQTDGARPDSTTGSDAMADGSRDGGLLDGGMDADRVDAAARDGGTDADGATSSDGSVITDGSVPSDGSTGDTGNGSDSGARVDSGNPTDAGSGDGSTDPDGGSNDDAGSDGSVDPGDGSVSADAGADAGDSGTPISCDVGEAFCSGMCIDVTGDSNNCGGCGNTCGMMQTCFSGSCVLVCPMGATNCGGRCIDLTDDPNNCGACGNVCMTGICVDSMCSNALAGHIVLIGHDYQRSNPTMRQVLANAVFLGRRLSPTIVAFRGNTLQASFDQVNGAIATGAMVRGRSYSIEATSTAAQVPFLLANADVLLVYAEHGATDMELDSWGTAWSVALPTFLSRGGVVVVLEGPSVSNTGTFQILTAAGYTMATSRTPTTSCPTDVMCDVVDVTAGGDAVALGLSTSYSAFNASFRFAGTTGTTVTNLRGAPMGMGSVVVHRVVITP